jgi:hypothetical protein
LLLSFGMLLRNLIDVTRSDGAMATLNYDGVMLTEEDASKDFNWFNPGLTWWPKFWLCFAVVSTLVWGWHLLPAVINNVSAVWITHTSRR